MDPNPLQPAWFPYVVLHPNLSLEVERYVWRHVPRYNRSIMLAAGYRNVRLHFVGFIPPFLSRLAVLTRAERLLESVPFLRMFALYQIICAER